MAEARGQPLESILLCYLVRSEIELECSRPALEGLYLLKLVAGSELLILCLGVPTRVDNYDCLLKFGTSVFTKAHGLMM